MPHFSFYRCLDDNSRIKLATTELQDGDAATAFGIELAETILRDQDPERTAVNSRIVIYDANGEDLAVVISEAF